MGNSLVSRELSGADRFSEYKIASLTVTKYSVSVDGLKILDIENNASHEFNRLLWRFGGRVDAIRIPENLTSIASRDDLTKIEYIREGKPVENRLEGYDQFEIKDLMIYGAQYENRLAFAPGNRVEGGFVILSFSKGDKHDTERLLSISRLLYLGDQTGTGALKVPRNFGEISSSSDSSLHGVESVDLEFPAGEICYSARDVEISNDEAYLTVANKRNPNLPYKILKISSFYVGIIQAQLTQTKLWNGSIKVPQEVFSIEDDRSYRKLQFTFPSLPQQISQKNITFIFDSWVTIDVLGGKNTRALSPNVKKILQGMLTFADQVGAAVYMKLDLSPLTELNLQEECCLFDKGRNATIDIHSVMLTADKFVNAAGRLEYSILYQAQCIDHKFGMVPKESIGRMNRLIYAAQKSGTRVVAKHFPWEDPDRIVWSIEADMIEPYVEFNVAELRIEDQSLQWIKEGQDPIRLYDFTQESAIWFNRLWLQATKSGKSWVRIPIDVQPILHSGDVASQFEWVEASSVKQPEQVQEAPLPVVEHRSVQPQQAWLHVEGDIEAASDDVEVEGPPFQGAEFERRLIGGKELVINDETTPLLEKPKLPWWRRWIGGECSS